MDTFVNSTDAETDLCADRVNFIRRNDIMRLIPSNIREGIKHPGDNAHDEGFQELFIHLNTDSTADELRKLVVDYCNDSPLPRVHLSTS